ncbi:MAG: TenA family protein [Muribaculaceae bacterium]|nr:TenA family protein [Muribaculaceae bacterium]
MKKWSEEVWEVSLPIYEAILRLPFIKELADGTLDPEIFRRYIEQDNLYITEYSRVLAHIASRLGDIDDMDAFLKFAGDGVLMEKALHSMYVSDGTKEMSPTCLFYTSLLKAQSMEPVEVEAAAVLPCFWIYLAVGKYILSIAKLEDNPYADWIKAYSDPAFDAATEKAIAICDKLADAASDEVRIRMTDIYVKAARMEWQFWDAAYTPHPWEV